MSVRFSYGETTVDVQNPDVQNTVALDKEQVVGRSVAGARYRYDRGVEVLTIRLSWSNLRDDEKVALLSFFETTVDGVMTAFTYTDHRGTAWSAQFVEPSLEFTERGDAQSGVAGTYQIDGASGTAYPTTTRTLGVWATSFLLEVVAP